MDFPGGASPCEPPDCRPPRPCGTRPPGQSPRHRRTPQVGSQRPKPTLETASTVQFHNSRGQCILIGTKQDRQTHAGLNHCMSVPTRLGPAHRVVTHQQFDPRLARLFPQTRCHRPWKGQPLNVRRGSNPNLLAGQTPDPDPITAGSDSLNGRPRLERSQQPQHRLVQTGLIA